MLNLNHTTDIFESINYNNLKSKFADIKLNIVVKLMSSNSCRVKTLMKKTFLLSATNGPLSGAAAVGPDYRTLTACWKTTERVSAPEMVCLWKIPPAAKVFWRTSASRTSPLCTVRAVAKRASALRTPNLQPCQTLHLSQCLTRPTHTTACCPIGTIRQAAFVPKTSWST